MATLTIELPPHAVQTEFNLRRWTELLADRELSRIEGRIETDRHGRIILNLLPTPNHGILQAQLGYLLCQFMPHGRTLTECPISTADGVKAADVAWASPECLRELGNRACFPRCPEICVEVLSPGNTDAEIREKMALYFDARAHEVWLCADDGTISFYLPASQECGASQLCPQFPKQIQLG